MRGSTLAGKIGNINRRKRDIGTLQPRRTSVDRSSTFPPHMRSVTYKLDARDLENDRCRQVLLAALAENDEVRSLHLALEQFYQTQLVATELAARLNSISG